MSRSLIFASSLLLGSLAWAQQEPTPALADVTAETLADRAIQAMDALDAAVATPAKSISLTQNNSAPKKASRPAEVAPASPAEASDKLDDDDENEPATPPLLPASSAETPRGVDLLNRARMDMMLPKGRSHRGVHYPSYLPAASDETSSDPNTPATSGFSPPLASLFESDVVTRLDEDHVQFDRAKWVQYEAAADATGKQEPSMSLEIERGVYDLKNEILMTNQPVKIENQQFTITGDTMLHDRVSGLTRLTGRVRMTFYNEEPVAPADPPKAGPEPSAGTPPSSPNTPPSKP